MVRFSIIIPAYNVSAYLTECLSSVEAQAFQNYEILLIDDGSSDATEELCKEAAENNSKIRYFRKENEGLAQTRNFGIAHAEGEYLYFLDADDRLDAKALEAVQAALIQRNNPDILITRYVSFDNQTGQRYKAPDFPNSIMENAKDLTIPEQFAECYLKHDISIMAWLYIVKREYLLKKELFFQKGILHEDELWSPQIFLSASSIGYCEKNCYQYRVNREGSIMKHVTEKHINDKCYIVDQLQKIAKGQTGAIGKMYLSRAACILHGLLTINAEEQNIELLLNREIKKRKKIFCQSIQKKYMLLYIGITLLGVDAIRKLEF